MTDPFTRASAQYREAMILPHKSGAAFEVRRRPAGLWTKLLWGGVNALFGGVLLVAIITLIIGVSR